MAAGWGTRVEPQPSEVRQQPTAELSVQSVPPVEPTPAHPQPLPAEPHPTPARPHPTPAGLPDLLEVPPTVLSVWLVQSAQSALSTRPATPAEVQLVDQRQLVLTLAAAGLQLQASTPLYSWLGAGLQGTLDTRIEGEDQWEVRQTILQDRKVP